MRKSVCETKISSFYVLEQPSFNFKQPFVISVDQDRIRSSMQAFDIEIELVRNPYSEVPKKRPSLLINFAQNLP